MLQRSQTNIIGSFILLLIFIVAASMLSMTVWGGKPEKLPMEREFVFQEMMTLEEFGQENQLSNKLLQHVFGLKTKEDLQKTLENLNMPNDEISAKINKTLALEAEEESKNWVKIAAKFILWIGFLLMTFFFLKNRKITPKKRKLLLFAAVILFGIILGSDPSPMGTVKDAVVLFAKSGVIFPPRLIAFLAMLVGGVMIANKFLCSWGCQIGTLQDLIFRLGRDSKDRKGLLPQVKIPFVISNSIRSAVFVFSIIVAFIWAIDIFEPIDPFKIYNPVVLTVTGIVFLVALFIASLFIYRPWCHFFCPFGLVGWLAEKVSFYKIHVNYDTCTACDACANACPSTVMNAILKQRQTVPDCFACGTCIEVCPTKSIDFKTGKRIMPPVGKFTD